jgi:predicted phosphodiesterase
MKFDLVSDLHVDCWDRAFELPSRRPKILVCAGDVSDDPALTVLTLAQMLRWYEKILFVDGNHESYQHMNTPGKTRSSMKRELMRLNPSVRTRLHYLPEDGPYVSGGVVFTGRNGWWLGSPKEKRLAIKEHAELREETRTRAGKKVVVTHTVPHRNAVQLGGYLSSPDQADHYSNPLMEDIEGVTVFCFGHNHTPLAKAIGGSNYVCNPRGRPGDHSGGDRYAPLTISV